jgi:hypothetical protein
MGNLYSITTNQAAIIALFRIMNRYVGNLAPITGVLRTIPRPSYPQHRRSRRRQTINSTWCPAESAFRTKR